MRLVFTPHGWDDYLHWQRTDRNLLKRINRLLDEVLREPFTEIGKPEQLRHALAGRVRLSHQRRTSSRADLQFQGLPSRSCRRR